MSRRQPLVIGLLAAAISFVFASRAALAYVEIPYTLGRVIQEASFVLVMRVEKVDKERNLILYRKVQDLKGSYPAEVIKHNIGRGGFHPREWQTIIDWAEPGKTAVFFHNGGASETCIDTYWYQAYAGGEWWNMSHAEPFFLRSFAGKPEKLAAAVTALVAGQEAVVPCMVDGDKNALQLRSAKIQRLRASLTVQDYDAKRDFVGWGDEEFRVLSGMPGFSHYASLSRVDPAAQGIAADDMDGDGKPDLCLFGDGKVVVLRNGGNTFEDIPLGYTGGARAAAWADYSGDGKPDLLLITHFGPKLLTNVGSSFKDDSAGLPSEPYYNLTAGAWIDYDVDGKPDILASDGFRGLRLYRNIASAAALAAARPPQFGQWHYAGPFDDGGGKGFDTAYAPETAIDLSAQYPGKNGETVAWRPKDFIDGQANSLLLFRPENQNNAVVYLHREIEAFGSVELPVSLGSDDTLTVWLNGEKVWAENVQRGVAADQAKLNLKLKQGKNRLLIKICQGSGDWAFYFKAGEPGPSTAPLFEDVSDRVGLGADGVGGKLKGDHLAVADVNGDGRPDILYSAGRGLLAINTPQGFQASQSSGIDYLAGKVAPLFVDLDNDKDPDLVVPQRGSPKLYKNDGQGRFADVTAKAGDLAGSIGRATCVAAADFSRDGYVDLFFGCQKGPNRYFRNRGDGSYVDADDEIGLYQKVFNTRAIAVLDLNRDGTLDMVMNNEGQEPCVLLGSAQKP